MEKRRAPPPGRPTVVCEAVPKKYDSAAKRARQAEKRRIYNKARKSEIRTRMKKVTLFCVFFSACLTESGSFLSSIFCFTRIVLPTLCAVFSEILHRMKDGTIVTIFVFFLTSNLACYYTRSQFFFSLDAFLILPFVFLGLIHFLWLLSVSLVIECCMFKGLRASSERFLEANFTTYS